MWVTKLVLDLRSAAARRDLASPYELHRTLSRAVSGPLKEGRERLLWRLEPTRSTERPVVLVQTLTKPDWSLLDEGYAQVFPPKFFEPTLREGQTFHFRIRANPAKRARDSGRRTALKTREEKVRWLDRKLCDGGFRLLSDSAGEPAVQILQDVFWTVRKGDRLIRLQAVLFEGALQVVDPERAVATLRTGIGPGKALGLGLLSLHP